MKVIDYIKNWKFILFFTKYWFGKEKSMFEPNSLDMAFDVLLLKDGNLDYATGLKEIEAAMSMFKKSLEHTKKNNLKGNFKVWNAAAFINKISYDLKIVMLYLVHEKREWNRRYFVGQACLVLYEASMDLPKILGKDFEQLISHLKDSNIYLIDLKEIKKELNNFKTQNQTFLNEIRNNVAAHKDEDVLKQLQIMEKLNRSDLMPLVIEFDKILLKLAKLFSKLINVAPDELDY